MAEDGASERVSEPLRGFTTPDDVQAVSGPVLELRLTGGFDDPKATIEQIFDSVAVPN
ncbi:MAG: hypothetical protein NTW52_14285 [Planctomycetota bacterium]|nr:hypothetical protein [Planctomycetota bacterium]